MQEISPCIGLCRLIKLEDEKVCQGCGRSISDIAGWLSFDLSAQTRALLDANKRLILMKSNGVDDV